MSKERIGHTVPKIGSCWLATMDMSKPPRLVVVVDRGTHWVRVASSAGNVNIFHGEYGGDTVNGKRMFRFPLLVPTDKVLHLVQARRSDTYRHSAIYTSNSLAITAGCRRFQTMDKARAHWVKRKRWEWPYDKDILIYSRSGKMSRRQYDTPRARKMREKDAKLNAFSLAFVKTAERAQAQLIKAVAQAKAKKTAKKRA